MPRSPVQQQRDRMRRHFDRAAATYDRAAVVQREAGARLLDRLDLMRLQPRRILDAGGGTGGLSDALRARYPDAELVTLDLSLAMLRVANDRRAGLRRLIERLLANAPSRVCADIAQLPFASGSVDLICSGFAFEWVADLGAVLTEANRVLARGGLLIFATSGPDTWKELRAALAQVGSPAQHRLVDMHDIGDALVAAGFADPVVEMECFTLTFATLADLVRDLRQSGACAPYASVTPHLRGTGWRERVAQAYEAFRRDGRLPATIEVVYGHAWKPEQPRATRDGHAIVRFARSGPR